MAARPRVRITNGVRGFMLVTARSIPVRCPAGALLVVCLLAAVAARAQAPCDAALDDAARAYDEGRLDAVVATLEPCLASMRDGGWQAYRLLALAHLFSDRPVEADRAVHEMLALNPKYDLNSSRDPIELTRIIETYSIVPRLAIAVRAGLGVSGRRIDAPRSVAPTTDAAGTRSFALGSDLGGGVVLGISPGLAATVEALWSTRAYAVRLSDTRSATTTYSERLSYLTLPGMLRFGLDLGPVTPHIAAGYYYQLLLDATSDISMTPNDTADAYADEGVLSTEARRERTSHGIVLGLGLDVPLGDGFLSIEGRYEVGLADVVRADERYIDSELQFRYLFVDNGFRLRNFTLSLAYAYPITFSATR
jgi:hypothetical protein